MRKKKKETYEGVTTYEELLDIRHGKRGTASRAKYEQKSEAFRIGVLLEDARLRLNLTQEEVASRCGTNKAYISRIENDASDIRLSTLLKIIHQGLGGHVRLIFEF